MKRIIKSRVFSFILGAVIFGSISGVVAYTYSASQITYTPKDTSWKKLNGEDITNVKDAIDELYSNASNDLSLYLKNSSVGSQNLNRTLNIELEKGKYILTLNEYNASGYYGGYGSTTTVAITLNDDIEVEKISDIVSGSAKTHTASSYLSIYKINVIKDTTLIVTGKDSWTSGDDAAGLNYIVTKLN